MDIQEAVISMAILMKNEKDYYEKYIKDFVVSNDKDKEEYEKRLKILNKIKENVYEFGNRLAAYPPFFDILESWKVFIMGKEGIEENTVVKNVEEAIDRCSNLAYNIKKFIREKGFIICDMLVDNSGWSIIVRCNEKKSEELCSFIYYKYYRAIEKKLIDISKRFDKHCLPGLYTVEDAERLLKYLNIKDNDILLYNDLF